MIIYLVLRTSQLHLKKQNRGIIIIIIIIKQEQGITDIYHYVDEFLLYYGCNVRERELQLTMLLGDTIQ